MTDRLLNIMPSYTLVRQVLTTPEFAPDIRSTTVVQMDVWMGLTF